jgi:hypothetical protein
MICITIGFVISFGYGIKTVVDSDHDYYRATRILSALNQAQDSINVSINEGRNMMFAGTYNKDRLQLFRDKTYYDIDQVAEVAGPEQQANIDLLKNSYSYRITLQDEQILTSENKNGEIRLDVTLGQKLSKAVFDTENSINAVREKELGDLFSKDLQRSSTKWTVIYFMVTFMVLSMSIALFLFLYLIGELKYRRRIAEQVRMNSHLSADGDVVFGQREVDELLEIIEEGEKAVTYAAKTSRS